MNVGTIVFFKILEVEKWKECKSSQVMITLKLMKKSNEYIYEIIIYIPYIYNKKSITYQNLKIFWIILICFL